MGDVYLGYEEALRRRVAIKVLPAELAGDCGFVRRFHAEATAVARLEHPNVVPVYSIGQDGGYHFFVMQYVEGESLEERLAHGGVLPVPVAVAVLEQCLAGLGATHKAGLVHRDVKPENILLDGKAGRVLVADFGLVRNTRDGAGHTTTGVILGTMDYIAPEQARGQAVDGRADLYALGAVAYRMLSGQLPFQADTPSALLFKHAYERPRPLREVAPRVPNWLAAVVERLMAKDPADRYQTAADALDDLRHLREEMATGAPPRSSSAIVQARDLADLSALPAEPRGWRNVLDRVRAGLGRYAPGFVQRLQGTTRQVDGALVVYEERRRELAGLIAEAEAVAADLAAQARDNEAAAAAAGRRVTAAADEESRQLARREQEGCEEQARSLGAQVAEQEEQLSQMRLNLQHIDVTLQRLCNQRDVPLARLRVVRARERLDKGRPRPRRRVLGVAAGMLLAALITVVAVVALWPSPRPQTAEHLPATAPTPPATQKDTGRRPPPPPKVGELQRFEKHEGHVSRADFVPNTNLILTCGGGDGTIRAFPASHFTLRLWDRETGKEVRRFDEQHKVSVRGLAVSADGTRALSSSTINEATVCLWDVASGHCLHVMGGHQESVRALAFTPDGKRAISGSGRDGFIRAWDLAKGEQLNVVFKHQSRGLLCLACLSGERLISGGLDGTVRLHDLDTGRELAQFPSNGGPVSEVGVADGGKQILSWSKDSKVRVWDVAGQKLLREFATITFNAPRNVVPAAFSADGRRLLIGAPDNTVRLWDVETGQEVSFPGREGHKARPRTVSIARDGLYALSGDENGVVILWGLPAPK
jgi:hypothetical protein